MLVWTPLREGAELCWCGQSWERAQSYIGVDTAEIGRRLCWCGHSCKRAQSYVGVHKAGKGRRVILVWTKLREGAELCWW